MSEMLPQQAMGNPVCQCRRCCPGTGGLVDRLFIEHLFILSLGNICLSVVVQVQQKQILQRSDSRDYSPALMCAQFNLFSLFLPGQPTPTGPGKRVKFVKGLIPARTQKRSIILARGTKYQQGQSLNEAPCRNDVRIVVVVDGQLYCSIYCSRQYTCGWCHSQK